jgi:UDP-glucose 4-epimerase
MGTRVFLTGASGYLGGVLAEHLARLPEVERVTGVDLMTPAAWFPKTIRVVPMDIRSPDLVALMAGHDVVVHTAGVVLWPASMPARVRDDINLNGLINVARAAVKQRVRRFIHASSMAVYDPDLARGRSGVAEDFPRGGKDPFLYYWSSKAAAEERLTAALAGSDTVLTLLRPIYIVGPRNRATIEGMRANAVNFPGRNPRRQFVHEDDVADAFVRAIRDDLPGPYNVVPDDHLRMREVWRMVGAKRVPTLPVWVARLVTAIRWRCFGSPIHASWVADMLVDFTGSNARLKTTGWRPRHGSVEALRSAL